ncbi:ATP-binding protein [Candidatus Halocynthiibacter alkanivorans]|uniref:ATP-binding protein n=1 Tax=Candidatus Halocynthiibacter alkanivorans TaxID=2267619 RepID=UPI000DF46C4C|nr:ATP-binding protein [Candidatus Halocynthiibacter alkanivorans]
MTSYTAAETENTTDVTPHAASLVESLRDIGYSLDTALSDIIDNSVTAGAKSVQIFVETLGEDPAIGILDDGEGMSEETLIEAMRLGSRNPREKRDSDDLGRFGLGLKSASFSQCKRLTVVTRRAGKVSAATWDLELVADTNQWQIILYSDLSAIPWIDRLEGDGTLVVWENLDRLSGGIQHDANKRAEHINAAFADAERHLRLVFHRFMEKGPPRLKLFLNGRLLSPIDPFASNHPACQPDPEETLRLSGGDVRIRSFTLPHHKAMSREAWEEIGGAEGHLKSQGFYVYRGNRLIINGGWMGLAKQTELTKLSRIRVDIPNTMDAYWKIDVKKASAQLPPPVRERLKRVIERFVQTSKKTYRKRGQKLTDETRAPLWNRVLKDGAIVYRPNSGHPALSDFADSLPGSLKSGFRNCVSLLGASLPIEALHADMLGNAESVKADTAELEVIEQAIRSLIPHFLKQGVHADGIKAILKGMEMFRSNWDEAERLLDELLNEEDK